MKKALFVVMACSVLAAPAFARDWQDQQSSSPIQDQPYRLQDQQGMSSQQGMMGGKRMSMNQDTVRQVQEKLAQQGYDVQADGKMGKNTRNAIRQFQKDQGMQANGQIDQQTMAALGMGQQDMQQAQTPDQMQRRSQQQQQPMQRQPRGSMGGGMQDQQSMPQDQQ